MRRTARGVVVRGAFGVAWAAGLLLGAGSLAGCGGSGGGPTSLRVVPATLALEGGSNATADDLLVLRVFSDGSTLPLPPDDATWSSDDPDTATVSASGHVTGGLAGRTVIRVAYEGLEAQVPTTVTCPPVLSSARVPVSDIGAALSTGPENAARCVAIDTLGRIHVVWFDSVNGLRYARSLDGGVSFEPSVGLVAVVDAPAPAPIVGCSQEDQDDVYVVYTDAASAVRCLRSPDAGATWATPGVVTGLVGGSTRSLAVEGATVCVMQAVPNHGYVRSTDFGQTFSAPASLISSTVFVDVLVDPRGQKVLAMADDPTIRFRVSDDGGATFGAQVDGEFDVDPSLFYSDYAIDQQGHVFGVGDGVDWAIVDVDAQTIEPLPSTLTGTFVDTVQGRSVAVDGLDFVYVVRDHPDGTVRFQTSIDQGQTVGPEVPIDTSASFPSCSASFSFAGIGIVYLRSGAVFFQFVLE